MGESTRPGGPLYTGLHTPHKTAFLFPHCSFTYPALFSFLCFVSPCHNRGFCYFNSVAIAAKLLQQRLNVSKILIVDWVSVCSLVCHHLQYAIIVIHVNNELGSVISDTQLCYLKTRSGLKNLLNVFISQCTEFLIPIGQKVWIHYIVTLFCHCKSCGVRCKS